MRQLLACLLLLAFLSLNGSRLVAHDRIDVATTSAKTLSSQMDRRIDRLDLPVATVSTDRNLHRKLNDYLNGHRHTELMLGRAQTYFPIFEEILCAYDLPEQLKYLAVAESMLRPNARSGARAAGLWQLMPVTARAYGLRVDYLIDERLDPVKSTDVAARLLRDLFAQYGDWHLAVAAYNAGTTHVSRAIRRSGGSADYERVRQFLPRETRNYVGAYVAAAYTMNYYENHGLVVDEQAHELLSTVRIHRRASLRKLAKMAGCDYRKLQKLNPALVRGTVPGSRTGFVLNVPASAKGALQVALWGNYNLVHTTNLSTISEQRALSRVQGFRASNWMLGAHRVLNFDADLGRTLVAGEWSEGFLASRKVFAML